MFNNNHLTEMFTNNPFAELSTTIPPIVMQTYIAIMIALVAGGTLFDIIHKGSAKYFFNNWKKSRDYGNGEVGGGQVITLAVKTAVNEGLLSSEFRRVQRRVAHLLSMYGFFAYVAATVIMVFSYPTAATPTPDYLPMLWSFGALFICIGGYWFWFFIRVDVHAEGHSPFRLIRADLFIVSLLLSATFGLIWAYTLTTGDSILNNIFLALYLIATTVLFGSTPWSKFSHMFFKPAAAFQKTIATADGSRSNLPAPADSPSIYGSSRHTQQNY